MKYLLILILCLFALMSFAQRTPKPTTNPQINNILYNKFNGYVGIDSGLMVNKRDTNWTPINSYFAIIINRTDSLPYWWNGRKWQSVASPSGNFVKYLDSLIKYVTPSQLHDSLNNYVHIFKFDEVKSKKTWDSTQTFADSIISSSVISVDNSGNLENSFNSSDSLKKLNTFAANDFRTAFRGLNDSYKQSIYPPSTMVVRGNFVGQNSNDTLYLNANAKGVLSVFASWGKRMSADSVNIIGGIGYLKAAAIGFNVADSNLLIDSTTKFNLKLSAASYISYVQVPNKGTLDSHTDFTEITDYAQSDTNYHKGFKITKRYFLDIPPLVDASKNINQSAFAIRQRGTLDSVLMKGLIQTPSITSSGTIAASLNIDANGNWIKKTYLPTVNATLNFPNTTAQTSSDLTVTVTGAAVGDLVNVGLPASIDANSNYSWWVSASNTVTVRFNNYSAGSINPASGSFNIYVTKQ